MPTFLLPFLSRNAQVAEALAQAGDGRLIGRLFWGVAEIAVRESGHFPQYGVRVPKFNPFTLRGSGKDPIRWVLVFPGPNNRLPGDRHSHG
jgi:hypothetical protein